MWLLFQSICSFTSYLKQLDLLKTVFAELSFHIFNSNLVQLSFLSLLLGNFLWEQTDYYPIIAWKHKKLKIINLKMAQKIEKEKTVTKLRRDLFLMVSL